MTAPRPQARVILEVIEGPHAGQRLEFDRHDTILVGRGSAAQLRLVSDPHFSRHHFLLEVNPPDVLIRDLGSRNGTLVNGQKVSQCRLKAGDVIGGGLTRPYAPATPRASGPTYKRRPAEISPPTASVSSSSDRPSGRNGGSGWQPGRMRKANSIG
jgi:serine/threonine-protein kinase